MKTEIGSSRMDWKRPAAQHAPTDHLTLRRRLVTYFLHWRYNLFSRMTCFTSRYLGWLALSGTLLRDAAFSVVRATAAAACVLIATFLINDSADRDIDKIAHPERPIPRGLA